MEMENLDTKNFNTAVLDGVQVMCRVFWGPDSDSCFIMKEGSFFQSFEISLEKSETKPCAALDEINTIINGFESPQSLFDHLNECYVQAFVNSKEGITAPLYQSCYEFENAPMMGRSAVEMKNRFESKALSMENLVHEPPDHLAVELEYLFFLLQKTDGFISHEAVSFATKTMLPWVRVFHQRLKAVDGDCQFYFLAGKILVLLLGQITGK